MAVRAKEDAFCGFSPKRLDRSGDSAHRKAKGLLGRIEVVKLQSSGTAVVSAERAGATCFGNQCGFHLATTPSDRDRTTPETAKTAVRVAEDELRPAMNAALAFNMRCSVRP